MKRTLRTGWAVALACLLVGAARGRMVTTGTVVANPGATVSVPVTVDDIADVGAAAVTVGYDPAVVVCLGVDAGGLVEADQMTFVDSGAGQVYAIFAGLAKATGGGELMRVRFAVREGTQGLFSDVTLQDVQVGAKDGVADLGVENPLTTVNGMVRILAADAAVARLEERFTVWPGTRLRTLTLGDGDGLMADADGAAISVAGAVTATGAIPVRAPLGGWQTGRYALLETATAGLSLMLDDAPDAVVHAETTAGRTTYWADVRVEGEVEVVAEDGALSRATVARIRETLADDLAAHPGVTRVRVKGTEIPLVVDLGIVPAMTVSGTEVTAVYVAPTLRITEFDPCTGRVRIRVEPGAGNRIRFPLVTGCVHVYGTDDLAQSMRLLGGTAFDLTPYLAEKTKGEAVLTVSLGANTFIKVKLETETKQEGAEE